jgi:hypothetical protein
LKRYDAIASKKIEKHLDFGGTSLDPSAKLARTRRLSFEPAMI